MARDGRSDRRGSGLLLGACSSGGNCAEASSLRHRDAGTESRSPHAQSDGGGLPVLMEDGVEHGRKERSAIGLNSCVAKQSKAPIPVTAATSSNFLDGTTGREVGSQVQIFESPAEATAGGGIAGSSAVSSCLGIDGPDQPRLHAAFGREAEQVVASGLPSVSRRRPTRSGNGSWRRSPIRRRTGSRARPTSTSTCRVFPTAQRSWKRNSRAPDPPRRRAHDRDDGRAAEDCRRELTAGSGR